ncbi:MAG: hypothetical protein GOMPHAMPRED_001742 [Gomphillus americanus]|uniref:NmrA-like domain-containing protein n=1 Tax=Gomphillus americanus TaxID=1940652 RepID=A0A8H3IHV7_9LECA|nr:MAG: hypothetical protein GOMPHAMPRED_001742 [Gomphillus americanus]
MSVPTSILVLGSGELGGSILQHLAIHPHNQSTKLTLLIRKGTLNAPKPDKKTELEHLAGLGIVFALGDVVSDSIDTLRDIFKDYDTIIGASGMTFPAGTQTKILEAVFAAKVPLYIPWQFGVDYDTIGGNSAQDLFTEQLKIRGLLRAQDSTQWIILSTGMFTSFLFESSFGVVDLESSTVRCLGRWDNSVTVTAVEDIGQVIAEILYTAPKTRGVVFTAGQTIEYAQLADEVERVIGKEIVRETWDMEHLRQELKENPDDGLKKYRVTFAEGIGVSWPEESTFTHQHSLQLKNVETWLREFLETRRIS